MKGKKEMKNLYVDLSLGGRAAAFVKVASKLDCDVDIAKDSKTVDGKSIIGVMTLDTSKPLKVSVYTDNEDEFRKFKENLNSEGITEVIVVKG